jgi:uncharacterized protein Usg
MADRNFIAQLTGYSLTTAEILYRMPDHPGVIQTFLWQEYDMAPRFPRLFEFLNFWKENLDGPLYRITVCNKKLISPTDFRYVDGQFVLH